MRGDGNALLSGTLSSGQGQLFADLAENVPTDSGVEPGDVLVTAPDSEAPYGLRFVRSKRANDPTVIGVVSDSGAMVMGPSESRKPVALAGMVRVKVVADDAQPIAAGDLLVSSNELGHAMRAHTPAPGTVLGKALQPFRRGKGKVLMLVMPR